MRAGRQLAASLAYSACSVTMILANKVWFNIFLGRVGLNAMAIASYWSDSSPQLRVLPVAFQNLTAVVFAEIMRRAGIVKFSWVDPKAASKVAPLSIAFVVMLTTGFISLRYLSVPMVTVFKNVTNVAVVGGEWFFFDQTVSWATVVSILLMLVGALFASLNDLAFTWVGFWWISLNCLSTAGYVLSMRAISNSVALSRFTAVVFNNTLSCALLLLVAASTGELSEAAPFAMSILRGDPMGNSPWFLSLNFLSALIGFLLNFAQLWCVAATSATTYAVIGSLNKIPVTIIGYFIFQTQLTQEGLYFLLMNMAGGLLYSFAKINSHHMEKNKSQTALSSAAYPPERKSSFEQHVTIRKFSRDSQE